MTKKEENLKEGLKYFREKIQSLPFQSSEDIQLDKVPQEDLDKIGVAGGIIKHFKMVNALKKDKYVDFTGITKAQQALLELGERTFLRYV